MGQGQTPPTFDIKLSVPSPQPPPRKGPKTWVIALIAIGVGLSLVGTCAVNVLNKIRGEVLKVHCEMNLKSIHTAMNHYANEHQGQYPESLEQLAQSAGPTLLRSFACYATADTPAPTLDKLHEGGHLSYIYHGKGKLAANFGENDVLVYEPLSNHRGAGANVLFGDGHVEFLTPANLAEYLARPATAPSTMPVK